MDQRRNGIHSLIRFFPPNCPTIHSFVLICLSVVVMFRIKNNLQRIKRILFQFVHILGFDPMTSALLCATEQSGTHSISLPNNYIHPNIPLILQKNFEYSWSSFLALWLFLVPACRALVMTTLNIYVVWLWMVWKGKSDSLTSNT